MNTPRTIAFLGKSGSGKDTQADFVAEKLVPNLYISTGDIGRDLMKKDTLVGRRVKETLDEGKIFPAWLAEFMWQREMAENLKGDEYIIFPSSPRKKTEAEELDNVLGWLGRSLSEAVLVDISDDEAVRRLLARGRFDDNEEDIRARLAWFEPNVGPAIEYYEKAGRLHRVDGVGSIEEIEKRVAKALGI